MTALVPSVWHVIAQAALLGTPVLLLMALAGRIGWPASPALRHCAWLSVLLGIAALPLVSRAVTPTEIILPLPFSVEMPLGRESDSRVVSETIGTTSASDLPLSGRAPASSGSSTPASRSPWPWLPQLWGLGFLVLLADMGLGQVGLARLRRRAKPSPWTTPVAPVMYGEVQMPVTFGLLRPLVLLPREAANWTTLRRHTVLAHEASHVRRADWGVQLLARAIRAVFWFHPMMWHAMSQLVRAAEESCDQLVLRSGVKASDYAEQLLGLARCGRASQHAMAASHRRHLAQRIRTILSGAYRKPTARSRSIVAAVVALLIGPLTLVRPTFQGHPPAALEFTPDRIVQARWAGGGWTAGIFLRGAVALAPEDRDVLNLEPGGYFLLTTRHDERGTTRRYQVVRGAHGLWRSFAVDGEARDFDEDGREWLRSLLSQARHRLRNIGQSSLVGGRSATRISYTDRDLWGSTLSGPEALTCDGGGTTVLGRLPTQGESGTLLFFKLGDVTWTERQSVDGLSNDAWLVASVEMEDGTTRTWEIRPDPVGRPRVTLWENGRASAPDGDSMAARTATLARLAEVEWLHRP